MNKPKTKFDADQVTPKKLRSPKNSPKSSQNINSHKTLMKGTNLFEFKNKIQTQSRLTINTDQTNNTKFNQTKKQSRQLDVSPTAAQIPNANSKIKNKVNFVQSPKSKNTHRKQSQTLIRSNTQKKKVYQNKQCFIKQTAKKQQKTEQEILLENISDFTTLNVQNRANKAISLSSETIKRKLPIQSIQNDQSFQKSNKREKKFFKDDNLNGSKTKQKNDLRETRIQSQVVSQSSLQNKIFNKAFLRNKDSFLTDQQSRQLGYKDNSEIVYQYQQRIQELEGYILDLEKDIIKKERQANVKALQFRIDINDSLQQLSIENHKTMDPSDSLDQMKSNLKRFQIRVQYMKEQRQVLYDFAEKMIEKIKRYKSQISQIKKMKKQAHLNSMNNIKLISSTIEFNSATNIPQMESHQNLSVSQSNLLIQSRVQNRTKNLKQKLHMSLMIVPYEMQGSIGTNPQRNANNMKKSDLQFFTAHTQKNNLYESNISINQSFSLATGSSFKNDKILTIKQFCEKYRGINKAKIIIVEKLIQFYLRNHSVQKPSFTYFDPQVLIVKGSSRFLRVMHIDDCQKIDQRFVIKPLRYLNQLKDKAQIFQTIIWNLILIINYVKTESPFIEDEFFNKQSIANMKILKNVFKNYKNGGKIGNLKAVAQVILQNIF